MRMKWIVIADVVGKEFRQLKFNISPFNKNEEMLNILDRILWSMKQVLNSRLEGFETNRKGFVSCFSVTTPSGKDWVWCRLYLVKDEETTGKLEFNELEFAKWVCSGLR
nr:MAG TPA: hypothetical protein [Bacteriophage sp.]